MPNIKNQILNGVHCFSLSTALLHISTEALPINKHLIIPLFHVAYQKSNKTSIISTSIFKSHSIQELVSNAVRFLHPNYLFKLAFQLFQCTLLQMYIVLTFHCLNKSLEQFLLKVGQNNFRTKISLHFFHISIRLINVVIWHFVTKIVTYCEKKMFQ